MITISSCIDIAAFGFDDFFFENITHSVRLKTTLKIKIKDGGH
jgi:hypothetical protein